MKKVYMISGAVITGNIVGSTNLSKTEITKLMKGLKNVVTPYQYEFFRGDSFQVYTKSAEHALEIVIQLRMMAMKLFPDASSPVTDVRACIGIGQVKRSVNTLRMATDEAFVLSGRLFDTLKPTQRLLIITNEKNEVANIALRVLSDFADYLLKRLTSKQASVIYELLLNKTQTDTAKKLKKSQATINKHVQSAGWTHIEKLLADYKLLMNTIAA